MLVRNVVACETGTANLASLLFCRAICNDYHIMIHVGSQLSLLRLCGSDITHCGSRGHFPALSLVGSLPGRF